MKKTGWQQTKELERWRHEIFEDLIHEYSDLLFDKSSYEINKNFTVSYGPRKFSLLGGLYQKEILAKEMTVQEIFDKLALKVPKFRKFVGEWDNEDELLNNLLSEHIAELLEVTKKIQGGRRPPKYRKGKKSLQNVLYNRGYLVPEEVGSNTLEQVREGVVLGSRFPYR